MKKNDEMSLDGDKEYSAALAKLNCLKNQMVTLKTEEEKLLGEIRAVNCKMPEDVLSALDQQADAVILGEEVGVSPDLRTLSEKVNEIRSEMTIYARAIERQGATVESHRGRISSEICKGLMPRHRANVRGILRGVINLYHAQASERELRFGLEVRGIVAGQLIGMPDFCPLGRMGDVQSRIRMILREFLDRKFITQAEHERMISVDGANI